MGNWWKNNEGSFKWQAISNSALRRRIDLFWARSLRPTERNRKKDTGFGGACSGYWSNSSRTLKMQVPSCCLFRQCLHFFIGLGNLPGKIAHFRIAKASGECLFNRNVARKELRGWNPAIAAISFARWAAERSAY